jgi:hypothetical protein
VGGDMGDRRIDEKEGDGLLGEMMWKCCWQIDYQYNGRCTKCSSQMNNLFTKA